MADSIYFPWAGIFRNGPKPNFQRPAKAELKMPVKPLVVSSHKLIEAVRAYSPARLVKTSHKARPQSVRPIRKPTPIRKKQDYSRLTEFVVQRSSVLTLADVEELLATNKRPRTAPVLRMAS
mmetsp:Transcript_13636/g.25736  ORF Transcript_13636/g.25736 Transcript_13636/m.25736 type:complete len:122 (+) Transcript_13636:1570-1935(+)